MSRPLAALLLTIAITLFPGCGRYAYTRVFLHGDVEDEDGRPVPFAIVRLGWFETTADARGHYHMLYMATCLRGYVGIQGVQTPELETFANSYEKSVLGYHLDTIELVGGGSCPADSDKFLRVVMRKIGSPNDLNPLRPQ
jgi:hypothetical protein